MSRNTASCPSGSSCFPDVRLPRLAAAPRVYRVGEAGRFQFELRISDYFTPAQQRTLVDAAERWVKIVMGPESYSHVVDGVKVSGLVINVTADFGKKGGEVAVTRRVHAWSHGVLAGLPRVAKIEFDTAELDDLDADGRLRDVAIHELGHALGFGIVWRDKKLVTKERSAGLTFRGPAAMVEYARLLGLATPRPVPMDGGTKGDHWREKTFVEESMTTALHRGSQPLSRLTVASLKDLGYVVDLHTADAFKLPVP